MRRAALGLLPLVWFVACASPPQIDLVLAGGRVIDPETGLDAIRNVGISGDTIIRVSEERLEGTRTIDATSLVVAPGFIDLHQHEQSQDAYRVMALDGVTAAFELEVGVPDMRRFIDARRGRSPIHFGVSTSYLAARLLAWDMSLPASTLGPDAGIIPKSGPATNEAASPERLDRILATLRTQIESGALGIGIGLEYSPGATRPEVIEVFRLAARHRVPVFVHVRSSGRVEPGSSLESVSEVIGAAAISGAALHIVHVNSTCRRDAPECLSMMAGARARGLDVTTEAYPYTAGMTFINSAVFNPGWREKRGIDYSDLELPESGVRLTRERFEELHAGQEPRLVLLHQNPDEVVDAIVADPAVAIASDGFKDHPRGAGTRARVLGRYVRDRKSMTLSTAIRKMSLMPAQRLERQPLTQNASEGSSKVLRRISSCSTLRLSRTGRPSALPPKPVWACDIWSWRGPSWSMTVTSWKVSRRDERWCATSNPHSKVAELFARQLGREVIRRTWRRDPSFALRLRRYGAR